MTLSLCRDDEGSHWLPFFMGAVPLHPDFTQAHTQHMLVFYAGLTVRRTGGDPDK